jgi:DNA-binding NarL/FixJ family response regulator
MAQALKGDPLTERELQILQLLLLGKTNLQIAKALGLEQGTVKTYMSSMFNKAGVANRTMLALWAKEHSAKFATALTMMVA